MAIMARASSNLPDQENLVSCNNVSLAVIDESAIRQSPAGKETKDTVAAVARQRLVKEN
jgi:hypothetical protein